MINILFLIVLKKQGWRRKPLYKALQVGYQGAGAPADMVQESGVASAAHTGFTSLHLFMTPRSPSPGRAPALWP